MKLTATLIIAMGAFATVLAVVSDSLSASWPILFAILAFGVALMFWGPDKRFWPRAKSENDKLRLERPDRIPPT